MNRDLLRMGKSSQRNKKEWAHSQKCECTWLITIITASETTFQEIILEVLTGDWFKLDRVEVKRALKMRRLDGKESKNWKDKEAVDRVEYWIQG